TPAANTSPDFYSATWPRSVKYIVDHICEAIPSRRSPPRTVIGDPSPADGPGRNCWVSFSDLRSLCRPQNDAVRHHALPHETPQGDQYVAHQVHDHGLAS